MPSRGEVERAWVDSGGAHRLRARTPQQGHTLWHMWLRHVVDVHEENPEMSTSDVLQLAKWRLPLSRQVQHIQPIIPEYPVRIYAPHTRLDLIRSWKDLIVSFEGIRVGY